MKRLLILLLCLLTVPSFLGGDLSDARSRKKQKTEIQEKRDSSVKKKVSKYDRTFVKDRTCVTARADGGFLTLHKVKGKLYIELPLSSMDREMLIASTISGTSAADLASIGFKPTDPMYVRFSMVDSTVFMSEVNVLPDYDEDNLQMAKAVKLNSMDPVLDSWSLTCWNNDSSAVVFDVTKMFAGNYDKLAPIKSGNAGGGINLTASYNSSGASLGEIKAFRDNVTVKSTLSYKVSANMMQLIQLKDNEPFSVSVTRTILLLPQEKMRPRVADSRVGIFNTNKTDLNADVDRIYRYSVIRRWNIQPSDSAAWSRGEKVEPVKPIVFYLDDAFPESWKEPARKGVLRWNKAFEEIGFKNAVQIKDFPSPEEDPEFDPDNLKYSCIRYVPSMIANAMGPSWFDPSTGEIVNASVIVYNDIIKVINNWRFVQTSQIDPRVRARQMPEDVVNESIEYVIAHEAGHCLGFMHNMAASAAFPVDSLRSPEFTGKFGTTPSIMDYARFNYVAQPGDGDVSLTPPQLGVYDYFLVKYAYQPVLDASSVKEEAKVIEKWVDARAGDPRFRYGRQQVIHRYDPSAIEEDLGDDPVKAADYGVKNLKYILEHFDEWMPDEYDPDASLRESRYENLANQYNRYLKAVMLNIGGIYLTSVKAGTPGDPAVAVPVKRQKESLAWVLDQLKHCGWIVDRSLTEKFSMRVSLEPIFQYYTALELFDTYKNVILSAHIEDADGNAYTLRNWLDDMYKGVWESAIRRRVPQEGDRILQNLYVTMLTSAVTKKTSLVKVNSITSLSPDAAYMPSVDHMVSFGMDRTGVIEDNMDFFRALDEENGTGYVASKVLPVEFGDPGYGWQYRVNTRTIDESKTLFYGEVLRISRLLKSVIPSSTGDTKVHYQSLLYSLDKALEDNK